MANVPTLHNAADLRQSQAAGGISQLVPTGSVLTFAGSAAPTGWLVCDGASLSTTAYASLFAVIGYTFGGSGGSFNLPDLRGRFVRYDDNMGNHGIAGVTAANAANRDSERGHGSAQGQATAKNGLNVSVNNHNAYTQTISGGPSAYKDATSQGGSSNPDYGYFNTNNVLTTTIPAQGHTVTVNGDVETRPINIALNAIIKI